jgi:alpha-methylacyl-CoA racemase
MAVERTGPLRGVRVVEIGALGPAPFGSMVLADLGADVFRIERPDKVAPSDTVAVHAGLSAYDFLSRGRLSAAVDLKHPDGVALVRRLCRDADVFVEGFRPDVAERLGVGPDVLCADNPRLVYARMTGFGQDGPLAREPGHDLTYLALAGVQAHIGRAGQSPTPPLNLVADFGGGGMLLALGVCAALVERATSGRGQVVDAAMVDGAALLMTPLFGASLTGFWSDDRGTNLLDSGAPFYDCYECADGGYVAVAAIEPQFYAALLDGLGLDPAELPDQNDQSRWPELRDAIGGVLRTRSRDEWAGRFEHAGACVAPVLTMREATEHPHHVDRGTFVEVAGAVQPGPAPRFSRTPAAVDLPPQLAGANTDQVLADWGIEPDELARLRDAGAIA